MQQIRTAFGARYNTPLIADAAFRAKAEIAVPHPGIVPLVEHHAIAGAVRTVNANNDLVAIIAAVGRAAPGEVVVIANAIGDAGLIGDLIGTDAKRQGLAGVIVDGLVRDVAALVELDLPVFCRGRCPVGPLKLAPELRGTGELDIEVSVGQSTVRPGMWAFGDQDGVIFVAADDLPAVTAEAERALERESAVLEALERGSSLSELLAVEEFLELRAKEPSADFNAHLAAKGRAI